MTKKKKVEAKENRFTKEQVLASKNLSYGKDLINAILEDTKSYTLKEVESIVNKYLKGSVK